MLWRVICNVLMFCIQDDILNESSSDFVVLCDSNLCLKDSRFVANGFNSFWLGLEQEPTTSYPSKERIEEIFSVAANMSATTIRSHTLGFSSGSELALYDGDSELNEEAWGTIDFALSMAHKYNIRLICPLTDNYWYYHGSYSDFVMNGDERSVFWTDRDTINRFKGYIESWLTHMNELTGYRNKDDPMIAIIELGNELGNMRRDGDVVPPESWIREISEYIKSIDVNHLVMDGSDESLGESNNFNIESIDVYSRHYYHADIENMRMFKEMAEAVGKPFIVGEYSSMFSEDELSRMLSLDLDGSLFWSMYGSDGIRHEDGFTIYPDDVRLNILSDMM